MFILLVYCIMFLSISTVMICTSLEGMFKPQGSLSKAGKCVWGLADVQRSRYIEPTDGQCNLVKIEIYIYIYMVQYHE